MARQISLFALAALLGASLPCQRPRTPEQALSKFAKVEDANEAGRRRAVSDLGAFDDAAVTTLLLSELDRAESLSYRQTVVRALGRRHRPTPNGVVQALEAVLQSATNARLCDAAGEGLGRQGEDGVDVLGRVLEAERKGIRRHAACAGLEVATGDTARDLLITEINRAAGRSRMSPFEALARRTGEAEVDDLRRTLARDKDYVVAAEAIDQLARHDVDSTPALALELARRLPAKATAEHHAAVLHGLLRGVVDKHHEPILKSAATARGAFGDDFAELWREALLDPAFRAFLFEQGPTRKAADQRRAAANALMFVPPADRSESVAALSRLLADKDNDVVRAAARALAGCGAELALPPLEESLSGGKAAQRPIAAEAIHTLRRAEAAWHVKLLELADARDARLRATALQLLAQCQGLDAALAVPVAGANLDHKSWQVRVKAIELLAALRQADGIPLLIERVGAEQARLREDVTRALQELTRLRLADRAAWRSWWRKEGADFRVPSARPQDADDRRGAGGTVATYWNIPVNSDRVAFVVDVSGSMTQPFGTGGTCLDEARRQLVRVLGQLGPKARANIIAFHHDTNPWQSKLQKIDKKRRTAGTRFADSLESRGGTNVHAAMRLCFDDPDVDTIFLLTDGRPSAGLITAPDTLADEIASWNLGRGIRIHTVSIGGRSRFLQRLADESGGEHNVAR